MTLLTRITTLTFSLLTFSLIGELATLQAQQPAPFGVGTFGTGLPYNGPAATLHLQNPNAFLRVTSPVSGMGAVNGELLSGWGSTLAGNRDVVLKAGNDAKNLIFTTANEFSGDILFATQVQGLGEFLRMKIYNNGDVSVGGNVTIGSTGLGNWPLDIEGLHPGIQLGRYETYQWGNVFREYVTMEIATTSSRNGIISPGDFVLYNNTEDDQAEDIILLTETDGDIKIGVEHVDGNWNVGIIVTDDLQVGIGTLDPGSYKLAVEGKIGAREIEVLTTSPWPDYVFEQGYNLMPIDSLESSIQSSGHLPGLPSAQEIENSGLNLGNMQAMLLEKIEELTLYVIDQNKQIGQLENQIKELKSRLNTEETEKL